MRYEKDRSTKTQRKIVEAASKLFRRHGIHATGMQALMAEAGLTRGCFYAHFESKEELVRHSLSRALERRYEIWHSALSSEGADIHSIIRSYLSSDNRDEPKEDCVLATLASELARHPEATRLAIEAKMNQIIDLLASRLPAHFSGNRRRKAIAIYTQLIGTLQIARTVASAQLSAEILDSGLDAALHQLN